MGFDPPFVKSLAAAVALLWLACIAVGLPSPEGNRFLPNLRLRPRLAVLGALAFGVLFAGIAAWEHGGVPGLEEMAEPGWEAHFEAPARTLSTGAAFVAIAVVLAGIGGSVGGRSRVAARGAILFVVVLLAGAVWPLFSIPRWCAWIGAPADLPEPSPLVLYAADCDPARWLDAWSRALHPLAPWGILVALAGIAGGVVLFRRATARADVPGREAACAAVACFGLLAICGACLEFEKQAATQGHESRMRDWKEGDNGYARHLCTDEWVLDSEFLVPTRPAAGGEPARAIDAAAEADLFVVDARVSTAEASEPSPTSVSVILNTGSSNGNGAWTVSWGSPSRRPLRWWYPGPIPPEPDIGPPASSALTWFALAAGFFAALFGEFHLRGRRLLRDPVTNLPAPDAA